MTLIATFINEVKRISCLLAFSLLRKLLNWQYWRY